MVIFFDRGRSGAILMLIICVAVATVCGKPCHGFLMVLPLTSAHFTHFFEKHKIQTNLLSVW